MRWGEHEGERGFTDAQLVIVHVMLLRLPAGCRTSEGGGENEGEGEGEGDSESDGTTRTCCTCTTVQITRPYISCSPLALLFSFPHHVLQTTCSTKHIHSVSRVGGPGHKNPPDPTRRCSSP